MSAWGPPILFALVVWWATTGAILYLDGLPRRTFRWTLLGATAVLVASTFGLLAAATDTSPAGAYLAFTCGLLAWGWHAVTFYTGFLAGPRVTPCPPGAKGLQRFLAASATSLYHELAILIGALAIVALTRDAPNQIGLWTYLVLWWMHLSGKLNVFLGVPNLAEEFLPEHLSYLRSYMRVRPMNLLFPLSVTVSTVITVDLARAALAAPASSAEAVGLVLLATLMALAVLEHWLLVLPVPGMALWAWSLASRKHDGGTATQRSAARPLAEAAPGDGSDRIGPRVDGCCSLDIAAAARAAAK